MKPYDIEPKPATIRRVEKRRCRIEVIKFKATDEPGDFRYKWRLVVFSKGKMKNQIGFTIKQNTNGVGDKNHAIMLARRVIKEFLLYEDKKQFKLISEQDNMICI